MLRTIVVAFVAAALVLLVLVWMAGRGVFGGPEDVGEVTGTKRPAAVVGAATKMQAAAAREVGARGAKQILFGDLHVHTTFSFDAFMFSLPLLQGEGSHPPADACDFARYCSALDFWSINDHAFSITSDEWRETVESIRQCNTVAGKGKNPDTVAFLGWEWTQVGTRPDNHYGHKNVILASTEEDEIPSRPIAAPRAAGGTPPVLGRGAAALVMGGRMHDLAWMFNESETRDHCEPDTHTRTLPRDCREVAETPQVLFRKLNEWGHDAIVIPHGTSWGFYTPPGSTWDKQLKGAMHDPDRQTLIEVYSGHGDSEPYRDWRAVEIAEDGTLRCPEPREEYLPSCWHAGELIRERCLAAGESVGECEGRAELARQHAADARIGVQRTVPGSRGPDWLDAGQCRDCAEPAFNYRPGGSAQYIAAIGNFDEEGEPRHFRMGFMASSDNHRARPGTGYKEVHRLGFTESRARAGVDPNGGLASSVIGSVSEEKPPHSLAFSADEPSFNVFETERQASFLLTGGLIAAHSEGRDRAAIWDSMKRREVYGTSGPRMLLWFDMLNPPGSGGRGLPMGGEVEMTECPIFQARAVGSLAQQPDCPDYATQALSSQELERICKGECYNPRETRRLITRIEVVRIRPQNTPDEKLASLIDDPWKSFACDPDPGGCAVTFSDPEFVSQGRNTLYYVRAFEESAPAVNADNVRCKRDEQGQCQYVNLCPNADGSDPDCLAEHEPRAWSSPIYVDFSGPQPAEG